MYLDLQSYYKSIQKANMSISLSLSLLNICICIAVRGITKAFLRHFRPLYMKTNVSQVFVKIFPETAQKIHIHLVKIFYNLHTNCNVSYFIYYAMTTSFNNLIIGRLLKKSYFYPFALKMRHLYSYKHYDSSRIIA